MLTISLHKDNIALFVAIFYLTMLRDLLYYLRLSKHLLIKGESSMLNYDLQTSVLSGTVGSISVPENDEITRKLTMLIEGECQGLGSTHAAKKYGYTKQRYFQLLHEFEQNGAIALKNGKRGPKANYRRTEEMIRQVIRQRFLDPDATAEVIAQKIRECGHTISIRSVERIISEYGLQKKSLHSSS